jgi:hypothetical protein
MVAHAFVLGPSGTGKSFIGEYISTERRYLHVEIDRFPEGDGIDLANLRTEWDEFFVAAAAASLSAALTARAAASAKVACVLTFPSGVVLSTAHIAAAQDSNIIVRYLYGSAADCIRSFLEREQSTARNLPVEHWLANNGCAYLQVSRPEFAPYRIATFEAGGVRASAETLAAQIVGGC